MDVHHFLLGTYGKVHFVRTARGQTQARARFRDFDGRLRPVAEATRANGRGDGAPACVAR